MLKRRRQWLAYVGLLALLLLLAACGSDSVALPVVGPTYGGSVTEGIVGAPASLLPEGSAQPSAAQVAAALWAPLFYGDNTGTIQPGLALEVPTRENGEISADGKTYSIHLRPDLHWSDGSSLTADDVVFTLNLMRDPTYGAQTNQGAFEEIANVTEPDLATITITLMRPDAAFLAHTLTDALTFAPLPRRVYGAAPPATILTSPAYAAPKIVSGPFEISTLTPGQRIALVRNPNYYRDPQPYLNTLTFSVFDTQEALLAALQNGKVDAASSLNVAYLDQYKAISADQVFTSGAPGGYEALYFNEASPLLADISVRKALTETIDPQALIADIWHGVATTTCDEQVGTFAHDPSLIPCYTHDQVMARTILGLAGWRPGSDGYLQRNGKTLALRYVTVTDDPQRVAVANAIQQQLKAVGIKLTITSYAAQDFTRKGVGAYGAYDIADGAATLGYDPDHGRAWACALLITPGVNLSHYCNAEVDSALISEHTTLDQAARAAAFATIQQDLLRDLPVMYLYAYPTISCATMRLQGYAPSGVGSLDAWNVWDWRLV